MARRSFRNRSRGVGCVSKGLSEGRKGNTEAQRAQRREEEKKRRREEEKRRVRGLTARKAVWL
jgi:hypothetical protein